MEFMRLMVDFYQHGKLVKGLNLSFIVLIAKKEEARNLNDYRPISLVKGIYKIISKVLASKMLDFIISDQQ